MGGKCQLLLPPCSEELDEPLSPPPELFELSEACDSAADDDWVEREGVDERPLEDERRVEVERRAELFPALLRFAVLRLAVLRFAPVLRLALLRDFEAPALREAELRVEDAERFAPVRPFDALLRDFDAVPRLFDAVLRLFEAVPRLFDALLRFAVEVLRLFEAVLRDLVEERFAPVRALVELRLALLFLAEDFFAEEAFFAPPRDFVLLLLRFADDFFAPPRDFEEEERDFELLFFEEEAEERLLRFFAGMGFRSF